MLFDVEETFQGAVLEKLPESLKISGPDDPELLLILRILSGTASLHYLKDDLSIELPNNYFLSNLSNFKGHWRQRFPKLISGETNAGKLSEFIHATRYKNRGFYKILLSELSMFFLQASRDSHVSAFLFLYRALERISYAFPLVYVSQSHDFSRSYSSLQQLMSKDRGELQFFEKFVNEIFKDSAFQDLGVDFRVVMEDSNDQKVVFRELKRLVKDDWLHASTVEDEVISVNFMHVGSFIITLRNRIFHRLSDGQENVSADGMIDPDRFFACINDQALYWMSTILLTIVASNIDDSSFWPRR
jgi:hypothetical protein